MYVPNYIHSCKLFCLLVIYEHFHNLNDLPTRTIGLCHICMNFEIHRILLKIQLRLRIKKVRSIFNAATGVYHNQIRFGLTLISLDDHLSD